MKSSLRAVASLLLAAALASPACAGRLDLRVRGGFLTPQEADDGVTPRAGWTPGNPLDLRGRGVPEQALSRAGYLAFGTMGLVESMPEFGRDNDATVSTLGFALIRLIQAWNGYTAWKGVNAIGWSF